MFAVPQTEEVPAPLVLSDIKPSIFLAVLEFIYTNCCSLSTDMVSDKFSFTYPLPISKDIMIFWFHLFYTRSLMF